MMRDSTIAARAIVFTGIGEVALTAVTVPSPGEGEVLIETAFSAISPGTERRCLRGQQTGAPPFPFVPGYALTGIVQQVGPGVSLAVGTPVFCAGTRKLTGANRLWGSHLSHAVLPAREVLPLPATLALADATLIRLAAIAYHGLRLAKPLPSETVAVVGLGIVGTLAARLYHLAGCAVVGVEPLVSRWPPQLVVAPTIAEARAALPAGAAIVVDATGVPAVLEEALTLARALPWDDSLEAGARLVLQGSYPGSFALPYDSLFLNEVTALTPRNCQPRDERAVLDLLARQRLTVRDLYAVRAVADAPTVYAQLGTPDTPHTFVFDWSTSRT